MKNIAAMNHCSFSSIQFGGFYRITNEINRKFINAYCKAYQKANPGKDACEWVVGQGKSVKIPILAQDDERGLRDGKLFARYKKTIEHQLETLKVKANPFQPWNFLNASGAVNNPNQVEGDYANYVASYGQKLRELAAKVFKTLQTSKRIIPAILVVKSDIPEKLTDFELRIAG